MNVYQRLRERIMGEGGSKDVRSRVAHDESKNSINEIQILEGHTDIVRYLARVDESRWVLVPFEIVPLLFIPCHSSRTENEKSPS